MKPLLVAVLFCSLNLIAQAPPVVTSLTPDSGPESGGTTVIITGDNLTTPVQCLIPCPPRVIFGDVEVDATEESSKRMRVVTPAHAAGVVDVTIAITGYEPLTIPGAFTFVEGPEALYERVLLPIYFSGVLPGANGTRWKTDFWLRNGGGTAVSIAQRVCPPDLACPAVFPLTLTLDPLHSLHNPVAFFAPGRTNPSQLLYIGEDGSENVTMSLRVADVSRDSLNAGTDLPVIREREFLTRDAQLFDVPIDPRKFRVLLRVYDVTYENAEFAVRIFPSDEKPVGPLYGTTLKATTPRAWPFRDEAAYAELDITALHQFPQPWPASVRIEIAPMTPGSHYWAFVSLTSNETQLVTLVTPQ